VGAIYDGIVKSIQPYGAFVEIKKGTDGLLHISEIEWKRLEKVEEVLKEGDEVQAKIISVDRKNRTISLSIKAKDAEEEKTAVKEHVCLQ
jgi:polyribonucleotide nucleotidyltransferase